MTTSTSRRLRAQNDVLVRQVERFRAQIDDGDPWYEALMLEWYARFQPEAFTTVLEDCRVLHAEVAARDDFMARTWQHALPLHFAATEDYEVPPYAISALNDADYGKRARTRMAVYWAAPMVMARALHGACLEAVRTDRAPREMAFLAAISVGGLDAVWRLREQLPGYDGWLDHLVNDLARGAVVWNPFAQEIAKLTLYMLAENTGMREEAAHWRTRYGIKRDEAALRTSLRVRVAPLMGAHANLADIERMSRWQQKDEQVRCPLFIGNEWYRLMRADDGRCWVEQRRPGDYWSPTSAVSVADFITELRNVKRV